MDFGVRAPYVISHGIEIMPKHNKRDEVVLEGWMFEPFREVDEFTFEVFIAPVKDQCLRRVLFEDAGRRIVEFRVRVPRFPASGVYSDSQLMDDEKPLARISISKLVDVGGADFEHTRYWITTKR